MIVGLTGYAQSGKDTVAEILSRRYGFVRIAFADKIRDVAYDLNPIVKPGLRLKDAVDEMGWEKAKIRIPEVRTTLQNLGMACREHLDDRIWVNQALRKFEAEKHVVITDVRFTNEADWLRLNGAQIWRIRRTGIDAANDHVSESQLDGYKVDQIFLNGGTLEDLEHLVTVRMRTYLG